ncbi:PCC domain-containing protein [Plantactinospora solaniradicis]|uniref:PCC domain-containing protein n=1 Tax=Plantactinospora solaniradicis TaxID=1723736 RepID=A0ABW1K8W4_9ACTN
MILVSVQPGQEVMSTLTDELQARGVANGAIVSLIGAVEGCAISTMELTGTGEVKDGTVHIHVVLGRQEDEAKAGHLHWGKVEHFFVNAYVMPL